MSRLNRVEGLPYLGMIELNGEALKRNASVLDLIVLR